MPPKHNKRDDGGRAEPQRRSARDENRPPTEWGLSAPPITQSAPPHPVSDQSGGGDPLNPEPPPRLVVVESQPSPSHPPSPLLEFSESRFHGTVEPAHSSSDNVPHLQFPDFIFKRGDAPTLPDAKDVYITQSEWESIRVAFPDATSLMYHYPYFIIIGQIPPSDPISIKGLIVEFYERREQYSLMPGHWGIPVLPDPLPRVPWSLRIIPTPSELKAMTRELESALGIHIVTLSFYLAKFVIEVEENEFDLRHLPGIVAGHHAYWGPRGLWGFTEHASPRKITPDPDTGIEDDSEYIPINPGVKVSGKERSTSCGVVIQNVNNGNLRLTVAFHGWSQGPEDRSVCHGNREIAEITEYHPSSDWGLCTMFDDVEWTNKNYFGAPIPTHFISSHELTQKVHPQSFFVCDGFTTGTMYLNFVGLQVGNFLEFGSEYAYLCRRLRASKDEYTMVPSLGACGAPLVHIEDKDEGSLSNAVAGFMWKSNSYTTLIKAVDGLMEAGWIIVDA